MALLNREMAAQLARMGVDVAALMRVYGLGGPCHYTKAAVWDPAADVYETAEQVVIKLEVPGVDAVTLDVTENLLIVRGERRDESPAQRSRVSHMEIEYGAFEKRIWLPCPVKTQGVGTRYDRGFLLIAMQKARRPVLKAVCIHVRV